MSEPTDILGKIGKKVGTEIKTAVSAAEDAQGDIDTHLQDTNNPHSVSKAQVGLGNVENTALSTFAGSENITTVGTLTNGTIPYSANWYTKCESNRW